MKILIINHSPFIGSGSGIYTMNIARALRKAGHTIKVITAANSLEFPDMGDIEVHPIFFKYKDDVEGQLEFNVPCFDQYPTSDVVFYNLSSEQLKEYKEEFRKVLEEEIKIFKPDIIHTQHIWIWSSIVTEYNLPTAITSHGSDMMGYNIDNSFGIYCEKAIENCDRIITISKKNNEVVLENFPQAKNKSITLKNGYDTQIFHLKDLERQKVLKDFNINRDYKKIVLYAGRLTENKGIDVLLNAANIYENDDTLTIIAGGGGLLSDLKEQVNRLNLENIAFVGDQTQENLSKLYNIADVLAVPSRVEGFGLVAIEALACGTPVVATNKGGMTDFINDEVGALVDVEDEVMLEKEISKILREERTFDRLKLSQYAQNNYSQEVVINDLINIYKDIINNKNRTN